MNRPVKQIFATPEYLGKAVAREIFQHLMAAEGRTFLLGCPGGRSPEPVYHALADMVAAAQLDLSKVVILMMDDYVVPAGDGFDHVPATSHFSCRGFASNKIQAVLNAGLPKGKRIADAHVWFPDPARPQLYDDRIKAAGGIDYFLLASGAGDGHVAFNPPGSPVNSETRVVELAEQTKIDNLRTFPDFASVDEVPQHGVTVGIGTIARLSKAAGMVVWGADKQTAYARLAAADRYDPSWPATVLAICKGATLYADRAAAGQMAE